MAIEAIRALRDCLIPALLVGAALPAQTEPITLDGEHFRIVAHVAHRDSARRALEAAEAARKAVARLFEPAAVDELPELHVYATADAYRAVDKKLTGGKFARNLAFAHHATKSAHVAIQPELSSESLAVLGPGAQTLRLVAHEATHHVRYTTFPNYRSHPRWFADGLASWAEAVALRELGLLESLEADPFFATEIGYAQEMLAKKRFPTAEAIFGGELGDLDFGEVYVAHWFLFQCLVDDRKARLIRAIDTVRATGGGADFAKRIRPGVLTALAGKDSSALDRLVRKMAKRHKPKWEQVFRNLETGGDEWEHAGFANANAVCWRTEAAGAKWRITGSLRILPAANPQLNVLCGRRDDGFVSIALREGVVTVFDYRSQGNRWNRVAGADCEIPKDRFFAFEVRGVTKKGKGKLTVLVDRKTVAEVELDVPLDGAWGLGAQARAAGIWKDVRAR